MLSFKIIFGYGGFESWSLDKFDIWFFYKEAVSFGVMGDFGVYKIDFMRFLFGEEFVEAAVFIMIFFKKYLNGKLIDVDDNVVCILKI